MHRSILLTAVVLGLAGAASAHAADSCPNAAFRTGAGASLPECRAWEQVSPVEKNGLNARDGASVIPAGDRLAFTALGPFGPNDGSPLGSIYRATRGTDWATRGIDPPIDPIFLQLATTMDLSDDLGAALVVSNRQLTDDTPEGNATIYRRDLADGSYQLMATGPSSGPVFQSLFGELSRDDSPAHILGETADLRHFVFYAPQKLTPDAGDDGTPNLYEPVNGSLRLVNRLPDGARSAPASLPSLPRPSREHYALSSDARRFTMTLASDPASPFNGFAVYQRIDGKRTQLISRSHRTGPGAPDPSAPAFVSQSPTWSSPDGTEVTFIDSAGPLTDESPADGSGRIYRWDADGDRLTDLLAGTTDVPSAGVQAIVNQSTDGRFVWFTSYAALTADANQEFSAKLYVLDTVAHRLSYVAPDDGLGTSWSADARRAVLLSARPLTGFDSASPACSTTGDGTPAPCAEAFSFDAGEPAAGLTCVSCGAPGTASGGNARIGLLASGLESLGGFRSHSITDDGRVFFDTPSRLVPDDANALPDVYEFVPGGGVTRITSGVGERPATFSAVDRAGTNALFFTADPLVGQDTDDLIDLYDARVDGGIASQRGAPPTPAACGGDGCRNGDPASVATPVPGPPAAAAPPRASFALRVPTTAARKAAARRGRLAVRVRVSAAGVVRVGARARIGGRTRTVASASRAARRAGTVAVTLRLSGAARRQLRRSGRLALSLSARFSRVSAPQTRKVTLTRPSASKRGGSR